MYVCTESCEKFHTKIHDNRSGLYVSILTVCILRLIPEMCWVGICNFYCEYCNTEIKRDRTQYISAYFLTYRP
jgi:hypothetical protein